MLAGVVFIFRRAIGERLHFPLLVGTLSLVLLLFAARSILDLLTMPGDVDIEFEPEPLPDLARGADLS